MTRIEDYQSRLLRAPRKSGPGRSGSCSHGLVTVVTVCFNAAGTIGRTIDSIVAQDYDHIEYIIVDGGSTDGTVDILRSREADIDFWLSQADGGISDAFNKGVALASGEFLIFVNSDDWLEPGHVSAAVRALRSNRVDFVFGDLLRRDERGNLDHIVVGDAGYERRIEHVMPCINHPTVVCRSELFRKHGLFDLTFKCAMDYEWFLRIHKRGSVGLYVPVLRSHMSVGGVSDRRATETLVEVRRASIQHGYPAFLAWFRFLFRLAKSLIRRSIEPLLSRSIYQRLRALVNRKYRLPLN